MTDEAKADKDAVAVVGLSGVEREALARGDNPGSLATRVTEDDVKAAQKANKDADAED